MLANAVMPMAVITLWFLVASITLTVRPMPAPAVAPRRPVPEQVAIALLSSVL